MPEPIEPVELIRGDETCKHWKGVLRTYRRKCCGGKTVDIAIVSCSVHVQTDGNWCRHVACVYHKRREPDVNGNVSSQG